MQTSAPRGYAISLARVPAYPALIAVAVVLTTYLDTAESILVLARPVLALVILIAAVQLSASGLVRDRDLGAYVTALGLFLLIDPAVAALIFFAAIAPLLLGLLRRRRIVPLDWPRLTTVLNVIALMSLLLLGAQTAARVPSDPSTVDRAIVPMPGASQAAPDIYVLMLDGHPRADTLLEDFGFDAVPFEARLESMGFEIAARSHSNYNATVLTLASVMNVRHVSELMPSPPGRNEQSRLLVRLINEGQALRELRGLGYSIVAIPSGVPGVALYGADRLIDSGQINSFELSLLRGRNLRYVLPDLQRSWFHQQQRERIRSAFDALVELAAEPAERPRFVFFHVMAPHPPILFSADGSPVDGWGCYPETCGLWDQLYGIDVRDAVAGQVAYVDGLVADVAQRIVASSAREAVIVVLSDHGFRADLEDRDEMLRNFFAARTPGHPDVFPQDATPINVIPRILNAYLHTKLALAAEDSYVVDLSRILERGYVPLVPWPASGARPALQDPG